MDPRVIIDYRAYMYIFKYYSELSKKEGYIFKNLMPKKEIYKLLEMGENE